MTFRTPPESDSPSLELAVLFEQARGSVRAELVAARREGDVAAYRFWDGLARFLDALEADLAEDPRDAPEVRRYLVRSAAARGIHVSPR